MITSAREKNNTSRMRTYVKNKEDENWLEYEHQSIRKHIEDNPNDIMYHWSNVPENLLEDSGYINDKNRTRKRRMIARAKQRSKNNEKKKPPQEYGLDGLGFRYTEKGEIIYLPQQAKYRTSNLITGSDLGTFHIACDNIMCKHPNSKGYLYYTTKLQADVRENYELKGHIVSIKFQYETHYNPRKSDYKVKKLHKEQKEFLKILNKPWSGIGLMCLPCGYGKFEIACHFAAKYDKIIVISPLRIDTRQAFDRMTPYVPNHKTLLFDSDKDGTTDLEELENIFKASKYCISTTEKSATEILSKYNYEEDVLILVDEIHDYHEEHKIWELLNQTNATKLGMSATKTENLMNMTKELIYLPLSKAIEQKKVCDYEIYLPILDENNEFESCIPEELSNCNSIDILSKVLYLVTGMYNNGYRHCILYLPTIEDCNEYKLMLEKVFEDYYGDECLVGIITAETSSDNRKKALKTFKTDLKFTFLCSVRILDQNVDIPICDSVFITKISCSTSEVRTLQRLGRAYRLVENHPNKVAGCFLWTNSDNDLCNMLNMIKSEDPGFYKKVKRISANYSTPKQKRTTKENSHTQETKSFVKVRCVSLKERSKQKMNLLIKYFEINEKKPSRSETAEYNKHGFNLGTFWWNSMKGYNISLFEDAKKKSPNMQKAYDKHLEKKEENSKKDKKTPQDKVNNLIEYFETNENQPSQDETAEYNNKHGFNLGKFWHNLITGRNKQLFEDAKNKSPNMQKAYDKHLEKKEKQKTAEYKISVLMEYFKTNENQPLNSKKAEYNNNHDGFNLGKYWNQLTGGNNKQLFEDAKKKSPNMKKAHDKFLKKREEVIKPKEKMNSLIEYFKTNEDTPSRSETAEYNNKHGLNLGKYWSNLISGGHNKQLFEDAKKKSPNMQKACDKYLEKIEKRTHKND
tara:strand:+ start:38704 stop:41451 length:2748 start_codon:yes stop_codon:yes gene_type:complete